MIKESLHIYHFNPTCEYAVGNGTISWQPNILLQQMESELSVLTSYFAQTSDYILVDNKPSDEFYVRMGNLGIGVPNVITKKEIINFQRQINRLLPWGWSPAEHKFLAPLKLKCSENFRNSPVYNWNPEHRDLYSKKFALEILQKVLSEIDLTYMINPNQTARICNTKTEIEVLLKTWGNLMIKAPWSSSGRGLQPITKVPVHEKVWEKILGTIRDQGYLMVEPLLKKAYDLAFQFEMEKGKIRFLGISNFATDNKGQYQGNFLNGIPTELPDEIAKFVLSVPEMILPTLIKILEDSALAKHYEGNFGVDTLIFWDKNQNLKINPCLEINVRQNMGLLSLQLEKFIHQGIKGKYRTFYDPQKTFFEFVREMEIQFPLMISNQKIMSGFFPLTDFDKNTMFGAYILVN